MSTASTSTYSSHRGGGRGGHVGGARESGGGGGSGGDLVYLSKKLSYILRHGAVKEGVPISKEGFVSMEDMMRHTRATEEAIMEVVKSNDKQRFAVQEIGGKMFIRANQGHSIPVEDLALKKVTSAKEIPIVVHGTYHKSWHIIKKDGLSRMSRNHIHFASGHFTDSTVISGMRKTAEVLIYIDAEKAMKDGIEFFLSENGVILTAGNARGYVEPQYFLRVVNSKGAKMDLTTTSTSTSTSSSSAAPDSAAPAPAPAPDAAAPAPDAAAPAPDAASSSEPPKKKTHRSKRKPKGSKKGNTNNTEATEAGEEKDDKPPNTTTTTENTANTTS